MSLAERLSALAEVEPPTPRIASPRRSLAERLSPLSEVRTEEPPTQDNTPPSLYARLGEMGEAIGRLDADWIPLPFGPWLPDLPALANPGATVALNVYPSFNSYRPVKALSVATAALDARARGAIAARDPQGNNYNYAGDASKLYQVGGSGVTDKSQTTYSTADTDGWEFVIFGDTVIATNYANHVQALTVGGTGNFADLITSTDKPKAKHIAIVGDFLVLGYTNDATDGVKRSRVWWSGINDATDLTPSAETQSDFQDIADGGDVQRIVNGPGYGLVFQQNLIRRMVYDGPPVIFRLDQVVDRARGTPVPNSVVGHGRRAFFLSEEGFFVNDGAVSHPIGVNQVDRTFWNQFDIANAHLVSAAIDPVNKVYAIAFPSGGSPVANKVFFYNWNDRSWSEANISLQILARTTSEAVTLEQLDAFALDTSADTTISTNEASGQSIISVTSTTGFAVNDTVRITLNSTAIDQAKILSIGAGTITIDVPLTGPADAGNRVVKTSLDALTPGLDSPQWKGGGIQFGAFDTSNRLAYFAGSTLAATIETAEQNLFTGRMAKVDKLRPAVDGGTITAAVGARRRLIDPVVFDSAEAMDDIGEIGAFNESRYHRFRVNIAAGGNWEHAQGISVRALRTGEQ